jgi:hypothetical protein
MIAAARTTFALRRAQAYLSGMRKLGYTREQSLALLREANMPDADKEK